MIHDSVLVNVPVNQIQTVVKVVNHEVTVNHTDTVIALNSFFKTFIYERQFRDTNIAVNWNDTITQNTASLGKFEYKLLKPTQIITNTTNTVNNPPKNSVWFMLNVGGNKSYFSVIPSLEFNIKDKKMLGLGFDPINKVYYLNGAIRIHL